MANKIYQFHQFENKKRMHHSKVQGFDNFVRNVGSFLFQTEQFGRLIAQHIVATRSKTIGYNEKKGLGQDETRLMFQKWLHTDDKTKTVESFLNENQLNVNDFVRFECGEQEESICQIIVCLFF